MMRKTTFSKEGNGKFMKIKSRREIVEQQLKEEETAKQKNNFSLSYTHLDGNLLNCFWKT